MSRSLEVGGRSRSRLSSFMSRSDGLFEDIKKFVEILVTWLVLTLWKPILFRIIEDLLPWIDDSSFDKDFLDTVSKDCLAITPFHVKTIIVLVVKRTKSFLMKLSRDVVLSQKNRIPELAFTPETEDDGVNQSRELGLETKKIFGRKVKMRGVFQDYDFFQGWVSVNCTLSNAEHFLSRNDDLFPVLCDAVVTCHLPGPVFCRRTNSTHCQQHLKSSYWGKENHKHMGQCYRL